MPPIDAPSRAEDLGLAAAGVAIDKLPARGRSIFGLAEAEYVGEAHFDPRWRLAAFIEVT